MASADFERTTVEISTNGSDGHPYGLRATGSVVLFDGFLKLYEEGRDDTEDEDSARLPKLDRGQELRDTGVEAVQHFTEPPPRFTEATLIREMERLGIGRPSTYASTMSVLREREYVKLEKKRLEPEDKGRLVTTFLEAFFKRYVEYDFTAYLEDRLDLVSDGKLDWKELLRDFWRDFLGAVNEIKDLRVTQVLDALNELLGPHIFPPKEDGGDPRLCPLCGKGQLSLKTGRFGAFIGCANYPECRFTRQLKTGDGDGEAAAAPADTVLGTDPETGLSVYLKNGRFGFYIQLGEGDKPKRASIPRGVETGSVSLEYALALLKLPREVGLHPESGKPIMAGFGRFGPFIEHQGKYAKIDGEEVLSVGLNRAVALLAEAKSGGKGRAAGAGGPIKSLGDHPELGDKVEVYSGKYGPYVKCGKVNATLPKDMTPEAVTMDDAVKLVAARIAAGAKNGKKKPAAKPKAKTAAKTAKAETSAVNGKSAKAKPAKSAKSANGAKKPKAAARKTATKAASEAT